ncbi:MAG: tripartite tricarboxylate transporter TctB family protein [Sulfurifustis sp.]
MLKLNDAVVGAALLALALAVLWNVQSFPAIPGQPIGAGAFPGVIAALIAVGAVVLMARGVRASAPWAAFTPAMRAPRAWLALAVTIGGSLFYIFAADTLGFLICGSVFLLVLMLVLRVRLATALIAAPLATACLHFAFYKLLRVPLPWGGLPVLY